MPPARQGGRILTHQRETADAAILGADLCIGDDAIGNIQETLDKGMDDTCRNNYRNRIKTIIIFFETKCPNYAPIGVREVSAEDQADRTKYYFGGKYKKDLVYTGLNVSFVKKFLSSTKYKKNKKLKGYTNIRKYHNAIVWGATVLKTPLPAMYYDEIVPFLAAYKKEHASNKKKGNVDEQEADPISMSLFQKICHWALETGNVFLWVWVLLQWHAIGRSITIDPTSFHHFTLGLDNIVLKYEDSKADKEGKRCSEKHMYDNPYKPEISLNLALAVYFCLNVEKLSKHEMLFLEKNAKSGSAANRFQRQLLSLLERYSEQVRNYIRMNHASGHGLRKGASSHAVTGTTVMPPIIAVALRGEWSIGAVLQCYWQFGIPGDQLVGRLVACLDPDTEAFATLPPHWSIADFATNADVQEAMEMMYGPLLRAYKNGANDPTGLLHRLLPAIIFQSDWMMEQIATNSSHPFAAIPVLQHPALLVRLKKLVTIDPTPGVMDTATGVPPTVKHAKKLHDILKTCKETLEELKNMAATLTKAVSDAIDKKSAEAGHVTGERLKEMLSNFESKVIKNIDGQFAMLRREGVIRENDQQDDEAAVLGPERNTYMFEGTSWHAPKSFQFPTRILLRSGWYMWLYGTFVNRDGTQRVRPFRTIETRKLSTTRQKNCFKLYYLQLFRFIETCPTLILRVPSSEMTAVEFQESFNVVMQFLRERVSYVFARADIRELRLGSWTKYVQRSQIAKHGTEQDKALMPPEHAKNRSRRRGQRRQRTLMDNNFYPRFVRRPRQEPATMPAANNTQPQPAQPARLAAPPTHAQQPAPAPAPPLATNQNPLLQPIPTLRINPPPAPATHQRPETAQQHNMRQATLDFFRPSRRPAGRSTRHTTRRTNNDQRRSAPNDNVDLAAAFPDIDTEVELTEEQKRRDEDQKLEDEREIRVREEEERRRRSVGGDSVHTDGTVLYHGRPNNRAPPAGSRAYLDFINDAVERSRDNTHR